MDKYQGAGSVLVNRSLQAECASIRISTKSMASKVKTMRRGLSGRSRGGPEVEIVLESAVPKAGMETDFVTACQNDADISVVVYFAGRRYQYDGWIDTEDHEMSVDSASRVSCTVISGPAIIT